MDRKQIGVCVGMEGGALRGLFTAGVLDVWMENGFHFDAAVGVSAGAAFGCNLKSRQIGRVIRYNLRFRKDKRYCSLRSWLRTGDLFGAEFCYKTLPEELDPFDNETFDSDPMDFYVVCTEAETGKPIYRRCDRVNEETYAWIRASASMPFVSRPVTVEGKTCLDGGISDPIPVRFAHGLKPAGMLVILTRPRDYVKKPARLPALLRRKLRAYPALIEAMENRHRIYADSREDLFRLEAASDALVICPEAALQVKRITHREKKLKAAYEAGRAAAEAALPAVRAFLERRSYEKENIHGD